MTPPEPDITNVSNRRNPEGNYAKAHGTVIVKSPDAQHKKALSFFSGEFVLQLFLQVVCHVHSSDRMITKKIRQSVIADKSLSTYAHNVKIITQNGVVTLKGPVNSEEEKQNIASKAAEVVGSTEKVNDRLTVKK